MNNLIRPILLAGAWSLAAAAQASPTVPEILSQLSRDDYQGYVETLVGFGTRYYGTAGNAQATAYMHETLSGFGLAVRDQAFSYNGVSLANVEATLPGLVRPDDIFIIGAHFDSIASRSPGKPSATTAPGADDNASGTAGVLEVASVLSQYRFGATIRFIGFNAEEAGMIGSTRYAQEALAAGDRIIGMIDLDMIGYTGLFTGVDLEVVGNAGLVDIFVSNAQAFTGLTASAHHEEPQWSDHVPFAASNYKGSQSVMAIDDEAWQISSYNNYYHTIQDTADRLDYDFALEVSRASAATLIDLAKLVSVPVPPVWLLLLPGMLLARRRTAGIDPAAGTHPH